MIPYSLTYDRVSAKLCAYTLLHLGAAPNGLEDLAIHLPAQVSPKGGLAFGRASTVLKGTLVRARAPRVLPGPPVWRLPAAVLC